MKNRLQKIIMKIFKYNGFIFFNNSNDELTKTRILSNFLDNVVCIFLNICDV